MSEIRVETKAAGAGIISTTSTSAGTAYQFADGSEIHSINRGILKPLSGTIGVDTTYTIPTGEGTAFIIIPKTYLLSSNATSHSLIITTGVASSETVIVPISPSGDTITSPSLMINLYIDSTGNVYSESFQVFGSNSAGSWIKFADGTMEEWGLFVSGTSMTIVNLNIGTYGWSFYEVLSNISWPASFIDATYRVIGAVGDTTNNMGSVRFQLKTSSGAQMIFDGVAATSSNIDWRAIGRWR